MKTFVDDLRPLADSMGMSLGGTGAGGGRDSGAGGVLDKVASTSRVGGIEFSMLRAQEVLALSHVNVVSKNMYELNRLEPQPHGCLDRRLGISTKKAICLTCFKQLQDCIGHFGHIELELPVFHIGYIKEVLRVLQMICKTCSRVLLPPLERKRFVNILNRVEDRKARANIENQILTLCKKVKRCPYCGALNGTVKKLPGLFKLVHELKGKEAKEDRESMLRTEFHEALEANKLLKESIGRMTQDLNPLLTHSLFLAIPDADCLLLNLDVDKKNRPEDMIIYQFIVPPACIRPSVAMGTSGSNEDDLTVKVADIIFINNAIRNAFEKGAQPSVIIENWDFLQQQVSMYVNSDLPGFPKVIGSKPIRALIQRLKGKTGRFRGNLSGKRVDFSSRTVISPDPNLGVHEVGVPRLVAKTLTYPERVHAHNIEKLRRAIINGPDVHPGANIVEYVSGAKIYLRYGDRKLVAAKLRHGDIVERHLEDGDVCLFNRQPSLHRLSIMAHRARILQWRTFRFNECVCTPYNADFDGDEMNLHVPQTEEARTESLLLMGVQENLVTPRHGEPLITITQDFITTVYLLTQKDTFYDRAEFQHLCTYCNDGRDRIALPKPAILKPMALWTGKQVFTQLLRPNGDPDWPVVNVELKEKNYTGNTWMCPRDGYVVFRHSELMCGNLCKPTLGGDKSGLLYTLLREFSSRHAAQLLNRTAKLAARWLANRGFSIGIDDVTPTHRVNVVKQSLLEKGYASCDQKIALFKSGKLPPQSGCNEEQTLEALLLGELSQIREDAGAVCFKELDYNYNAPLIMAVCGSKGSKINISQMVACVGQQAVSGKRAPNGFLNRTLPHFPKYSREPAAKGFVSNSFYTGLTATEFFFHTMGGREGLVDTAVKTAETGYMQRRLMKALEDLCVHYDGSVRTSEQSIVQFTYGDDGLDPMLMRRGGTPVNFSRLIDQCRSMLPAQGEKTMMPFEIAQVAAVLDSPKFTSVCSVHFLQKLKDFIKSLIIDYEGVMMMLNLLPGAPPNPQCQLDQKTSWSVLNRTNRLTRSQFMVFLDSCLHRYTRSVMEAGTAVGALGAQSIGEPGTQMTLKTFHFAGVASMNITLGVPRIKEIINAAKLISSPIITVPLQSERDVKSARIVKGRIEKTTLGEVSEYIEEFYSPAECYLQIKLDMDAIDALQLNIDSETVVRAILETKKLKLKQGVRSRGNDVIRIYPPSSGNIDDEEESLLYAMQQIKSQLSNVIVQGTPNVNRAVINDKGDGTYNLLVEGYNLRGVMTTLGVKGNETTSNHIMEMEKVLGIEAARATIMKEIHTTMDGHGLTIDPRHVSLLADIMTYRGETLGITRFGVTKMKQSVLMLASFEKTADHLFEAAIHGTSDAINGVSECIIMGVPIPIGTGLFQLMHKVDQQEKQLLVDKFNKSHLLLHAPAQRLKMVA